MKEVAKLLKDTSEKKFSAGGGCRMRKLENQIYSFVDSFFEYMIDLELSTAIDEGKYNAIKSIELDNNYSLRFIKEWGEKYYYLMLYERSIYRLELFLCRIIFNKGNTITWYLDNPTRKENQNVYKSILGVRSAIAPDIVTAVKKQQESLHARSFNRVPIGYKVADNDTLSDSFNTLRNIILSLIEKRLTPSQLSLSVIEGIPREFKGIMRSRNGRKYIELAKNRDSYSCKACGFKLSIEGRDILQVHHLNPLREVVKVELDDLACLCPTCHYIAHCKYPPYTPSQIKEIRKKHNV